MNGSSPLAALVSGMVFGLSGGLTPGPLLMLVIAETLKHDLREGIKVALAPLLTDLPIVLISVYVLAGLTGMRSLLGGISICGAGFLGFLARESLFFNGAQITAKTESPRSLRKGVLANFLNPSPYLFWLTVGAPMVQKTSQEGAAGVLAFITSFYLLLVGTKVMVAVWVAKSRTVLRSRMYIYAVRTLGGILLIFAVLFLRDGLRFWGVL